MAEIATPATVTIVVDSLKGRSIAFSAPKDAPLSTIYSNLYERAPWIHGSKYILTTNSRRTISHSEAPISSILSPADTFLPLRLTVPLCGGKGGFGSILRAQGGRMSSRKKQNGEQNGSSRNLDGRRLRTVTEAKALAEYLAAKPDLDKKERDEKQKRWEDTVNSIERKKEDILSGRQVRLDGKWVEDKEEAETKTREAIEKMLQAQRESSEEDQDAGAPVASASKPAAPKAMFGWEDEDDEFMSDSEEEEDVQAEDVPEPQYEGKGKGKAAA